MPKWLKIGFYIKKKEEKYLAFTFSCNHVYLEGTNIFHIWFFRNDICFLRNFRKKQVFMNLH